MKRFIKYAFILSLVFVISVPVSTLAQTKSEDVTIGQSIRLESKALGEERRILISLPDRYDQTATKYPVLYLLDGRAHFRHASSTVQFLSRNGRMPQMIVVAIVNVDRTRDFTPTNVANRPQSGGSEKFIAFMQDELFPYIESNYRTLPYRLLEGHSLGGMFSIHVLFEHPDMFQAHFAMSPYIMWDDNYCLTQAIQKLQKPLVLNNFLYITIGDEPDYVEPLAKFTGALETKGPDGLEWHYKIMNNDNHGTVPLKSLYFGLETLYKDWIIKAEDADKGIAAIENHYKKLTDKYGYKVDIPENVLNAMGYRVMGQEKTDLAIDFFLYNVKLYPNSANVYDSLGEGYEAAGKFDLAKKNYEIAVEKGTETDDQNLGIYKEHLDKIIQKIEK
ncbi:MAG: alpha/beta hydrolase-fold protein [candidate division KSB1 bacterium]|nr:alpha/beta hydrolase-fold protein [candidate division KSB1 bacterium]